MVQCISTESTTQAFIANAPLIGATIKNMELQAPNWYRDLLKPQPWPEDGGLSIQELEYHGELPQVEEGFDSWELLDDPSGCGVICTPNCGYNFHALEGNAFNSRTFRVMRKDFRTDDFCVTSISSTRQFEQVFAAMLQGFYNQIAFHKEVNVGQNFISQIAKKYVIDSAGYKPNSGDPYTYLPKGDTTLSALTIEGLEFFYQQLRMLPRIQPLGMSNGMPLYAAVASPELLTSIYRDDPKIRTDLRAAAAGNVEYGNDLIQRYNLNYTIRDMFLPISYLTPRRFYWDGTNLRWVRVLPWVKGVKGTVGTYTDVNPLYMDPSYATHEEIIIHGLDPIGLMTRQDPSTLGEGSSFGPQPGNGFWDNFQWSNPETRDDPGRLMGFYWTRAQIALIARGDVYAILVPRKPLGAMVRFYDTNLTCPPAATECDNEVAAPGCPSPTISSFYPHPTLASTYFVCFTVPIDAEADDTILLESQTHGYVTATVLEDGVSSDGTCFMVSISGTVPTCDRFVRVFNALDLQCSSDVLKYETVSGDNTQLNLLLRNPIRAYTNGQSVTLKYGDGTSVTATLVSAGINMMTNVWRVDIGGTAFSDTVNGVVEICVPTATVATCPGCTGPTETQCAT